MKIKSIAIFQLCLCLVACSSGGRIAPVTEGWHQASNIQGAHIVQRAETLYSIAFRYGYDYRQLAAVNHIKPPYHLAVGMLIKLSGHKLVSRVKSTTNKPSIKTAKRKIHKIVTQPLPGNTRLKRIKQWNWPVRGRIVAYFGNNNKGIDIRGRYGQVIHSAAAGTVVYSGNGIRGYGNLIIIKHSDDYLSAYAYNAKNLVRAGQRVNVKQAIATMGENIEKKSQLHFEIRRVGKAVNPLRYLR